VEAVVILGDDEDETKVVAVIESDVGAESNQFQLNSLGKQKTHLFVGGGFLHVKLFFEILELKNSQHILIGKYKLQKNESPFDEGDGWLRKLSGR